MSLRLLLDPDNWFNAPSARLDMDDAIRSVVRLVTNSGREAWAGITALALVAAGSATFAGAAHAAGAAASTPAGAAVLLLLMALGGLLMVMGMFSPMVVKTDA